jgi:lysophospholipase L1-like esterase
MVILASGGLWTVAHAGQGQGEASDQSVAVGAQPGAETPILADASLVQSLVPAPSWEAIQKPETVFDDLSAWDAKDAGLITRLHMHPELNLLQFYDRAAMERLSARWESAQTEGLTIVHVGDSHVQGGVVQREMRAHLGPELGDGGPGLLFPYSAAKTYAPRAYKSEHTGVWVYGKSWRLPADVPLGVTGMSVRTQSAKASFTLTFKEDVSPDWRALRIYCDRNRESFDLKIDSAGKTTTVVVRPTKGDDLPYVEVTLPRIGRSLRVRMRRRFSRQTGFELHGMVLQSIHPGGLVIHNAGVGASRYRAILHEEHFVSHLASLEPDMVIVEYGTNDYLYDDLIKRSLEGQIRAAIARIREAAPEAAIVLVTPQDLYRKMQNLTSGVKFSDLIHRIAADEGAVVFDWYWISGGGRSIPAWRLEGLARKDLIHLTTRGYSLKGRHLVHAIRGTLAWMKEHPSAKHLVLDREPLKRALEALPPELALAPLGKRTRKSAARPPVKLPENAVLYTVRSGECIAGIARRNGVSVDQIIRINGLEGRRIYPGTELHLPGRTK